MNRFNKKIVVFIIVVFVLLFSYFSYVFLAFFNTSEDNYVFTQPVIPTPANIEQEYSKINLLKPGVSTFEDVDKTIGSPISMQKENNRTTLFFNTPVDGIKNKILLVDGIIIYIEETVYSDYRGNYEDYVKKYGDADFVLYQDLDSWYVFLQKGVMIRSVNNFITKIVYFIPQNEQEFFNTIAPELDLSKQNFQKQGEAIFAP